MPKPKRSGPWSKGGRYSRQYRPHEFPDVPEAHAKGPLAYTWHNMIQRCSDLKHPAWQDYGGRGITVCQGWSYYHKWADDLGPRPALQMDFSGRAVYSIERDDNDRGYHCGSCEECTSNGWTRNGRWATGEEQALSRRPRPKIGRKYQGTKKDKVRANALAEIRDRGIEDIDAWIHTLREKDREIVRRLLEGKDTHAIQREIGGTHQHISWRIMNKIFPLPDGEINRISRRTKLALRARGIDLETWLPTLIEIDRRIIDGRLRGLTLREIEEETGVTKHTICQRLTRKLLPFAEDGNPIHPDEVKCYGAQREYKSKD